MTGAPASQRFAKVTISLPAGLLSAVEKLQRKSGRSRSEVIRDAVEGLLAAEAERADERRWLKAYRQQPQSDAELAWTESALKSLAVDSLAERVTKLSPARMREVDRAIHFAFGLRD